MDQKQVKTIDDYKHIVKQLKLKVLKIQKKNDDLKQKIDAPLGAVDGVQNMDLMQEAIKLNNQATKIQSVWRGQAERRNIEAKILQQQGAQGQEKQFSVSSNEFVMKQLQAASQKIGLSPEMLFRAADKSQSNAILVDEFKQFLQKLKLGLSNAQISRVVYLCDEDCSGIIRKDEYFNCLQAYGVNQEKNRNNTRTFGQQCLVKFGKLLLTKKLNAEESYRRIDRDFNDFITCKQLGEFTEMLTTGEFGSEMSDKEVVSLFNFIDQDKQHKIPKDVYIQKINQALRVAAQEQGISLSKAMQGGGNNVASQQQQPSKKARGSKVTAPGQEDEEQKVIDTSKIKVKQIGPEFMKVLQQKKFDFEQFTDNLIDIIGYQSKKVKNGAVITDLFKACNKQKDAQLSKQEQMDLFRLINTDGNGLLDYDEIGSFYQVYKDKQASFKLVLELYSLKLESLTSTLIEQIIQLNPNENDFIQLKRDKNKIIKKDKFYEIAKKLFWIENNSAKGQFYEEVQEDGNIFIYNLEKKLSLSRRNAQVLQNTSQLNDDKKSKKSQLSNLEVDLNKYEEILYKMKPSITSDDLMNQKKIEENKNEKYKKEWTTIFNNEKAALRHAYDVVTQMEKSGQKKWIDPEFGSNSFDQYGASSLYLNSNEIPPGCPEPEDVQWLHPETILEQLIDQGEDQYEGAVPSFISGGADSNDVKQSKYLGDCYFISALSLVAADDSYLQGSFDPEKEINDVQIKGMMSGVWPPMFHFLAKYGIYMLRFFKNYKWRYVMIDDRLPCKENAEIIYAQCKQVSELWVSLIEKAYAKIHNCYQALVSGDIAQALADMTGLVADKTKLEPEKFITDKAKITEQIEQKHDSDIQQISDPEEKNKFLKLKVQDEYHHQKQQRRNDVDNLWEILLESKERGTMMGCSAEGETEGFIEIDDQSSGIMSGHAYSVIDVFTLQYSEKELELIQKGEKKENYHRNHRILRIRNPWGFGEWKFKWSESEEDGKLKDHATAIQKYYDNEIERFRNQLNREPPERYEPNSTIDDGTFLMSYKDWRNIFSNLFQCINFPDDYKGYRFKGVWGDQNSFGVPKKSEQSKKSFALQNPQYLIHVNRPETLKTKVYISLGQGEGRLFLGEKYPFERVINSVLLCVFKLDSSEEYLTKFDKKKMIASSEKLNLRREVDSGDIELTNGHYAVIPCTKTSGSHGKFTLNIYHNEEREKGITFSELQGSEHDKFLKPINENDKQYWIQEEEEATESQNVSLELVQLMIQNIKK